MTENVWDYPRPPALVPCDRRVRVRFAGAALADSTGALRVLETSHPPTIYLPPADVRLDLLFPVGHTSFCEWKGIATYFDVAFEGRVERRAAWTYRDPTPAYAELRDFISLYPGRMDECLLDDEVVEAQPGDFYGGWVTSEVTGPFKGPPGALGW